MTFHTVPTLSADAVADARPADAVADARRWPKILVAYRAPSHARSILEIIVTAVPLALLWAAMWASLQVGYWRTLLLAVPAAGLLVRLFIIQHDCSHGAFFRTRAANDWVGRVIGVLTLTPHDVWRRTHAIHHASSGNLDLRGIGDVDTLTVREYRARTWAGRLRYRLYRHPLVMFVLGPTYLFVVQHRLPVGLMRAGAEPWVSAMATNAGILAVATGLAWLVGLEAFLLVQAPITIIGATIGVWLFYVQHQFDETTWDKGADWSHPEAALHGSSHYDLPAPLRWFTGNIGIHHVHHLCSRIPFYRLPEVLDRHPELASIGRLTLLESLACVRLVLWDEAGRRLVSFRDAAAAA
ncbi:fatty acid desaturase [Chthonobacter rhizosphaerae]|uniref:fatty acid desaturase n=1 Tax=Chthonobacter rhizosphaerae TaxID=2735553 RepID=UPI0015EFA0E2|nr:fatty acid desaturase [Chthonobacter rhizosphaerae]